MPCQSGSGEKEKERKDEETLQGVLPTHFLQGRRLNVPCLDGLATVLARSLDGSSDEILSPFIQSIVEIRSYVDSFSNVTNA